MRFRRGLFDSEHEGEKTFDCRCWRVEARTKFSRRIASPGLFQSSVGIVMASFGEQAKQVIVLMRELEETKSRAADAEKRAEEAEERARWLEDQVAILKSGGRRFPLALPSEFVAESQKVRLKSRQLLTETRSARRAAALVSGMVVAELNADHFQSLLAWDLRTVRSLRRLAVSHDRKHLILQASPNEPSIILDRRFELDQVDVDFGVAHPRMKSLCAGASPQPLPWRTFTLRVRGRRIYHFEAENDELGIAIPLGLLELSANLRRATDHDTEVDHHPESVNECALLWSRVRLRAQELAKASNLSYCEAITTAVLRAAAYHDEIPE